MHLGSRREPRGENWQAGLYLKLVVLLLAVAYAIAFVIENNRQTEVRFVFHTTHVSLVWLILLSLAIGLIAGVLLSQLYRRRRRHERGQPADAVDDLGGSDEAVGEPGSAAPST
jgi:uncharacterized integral membrane protein